MDDALRLSRLHTGQTLTNPSVGCVIVKDGYIVGSAVTAIGGRPHAETQALAQAGDAARGSTVYVTLEPCAHYGKTPPCADALVSAGVARVVVSVTDPDERVAGRGLQILRDAGIEVETGIMEREGRLALSAYLTRKTKNRPHVTLKLAISADGMIGKSGSGQIALTGKASRKRVHLLRAGMDAILIGVGTAIADDPELTCRIEGLEERSPLRIVLDRRLELPLGGKLVRSARSVPVLAVAEHANAERRDALTATGVEVLEAADLAALLNALAGRGLSSLLVEGGAQVARAFLDAGLVDRILLFISPVVIGTDGLCSPLLPSAIPTGYGLVNEDMSGEDRCLDFERGF